MMVWDEWMDAGNGKGKGERERGMKGGQQQRWIAPHTHPRRGGMKGGRGRLGGEGSLQ